MENTIPFVAEELYLAMVPAPNPDLWPEHLHRDPVQAHGLWSFYQGLRLGIQLADACLEKL